MLSKSGDSGYGRDIYCLLAIYVLSMFSSILAGILVLADRLRMKIMWIPSRVKHRRTDMNSLLLTAMMRLPFIVGAAISCSACLISIGPWAIL